MRFIFSILSQFFRWLASRNEFASTPAGQAVEQKKADAKQETEIESGSADVRNGNEDAVNRRIKRLTRPLAVAVAGCLLLSGCVSKVCYVDSSEQAVRVKAGEMVVPKSNSWLVPDGVFAILLEKAERYENSKEIKK